METCNDGSGHNETLSQGVTRREAAAHRRSADAASSKQALRGRSADAASSTQALRWRSADAASSTQALRGRSADAASSKQALRGRSADAASNTQALRGRSADAASNTQALRGRSADAASNKQALQGRAAFGPARALFAATLVVALSAGLYAQPAQAQDATGVLLDNLSEQPGSINFETQSEFRSFAQGFMTGDSATNYLLYGVDLRFPSTSPGSVTVQIMNDSSGAPGGTVVHQLTAAGAISADAEVSFNAGTYSILESNTKYHLVVLSGQMTVATGRLKTISGTDPAVTASASQWMFDGQMFWRQRGSTSWTDHTSDNFISMRVRGAALPTVSIATASGDLTSNESGDRALAFVVQLSASHTQAVTVPYSFGGTATVQGSDGADYMDTTSDPGTLTFAANAAGAALTQTITLTVANDMWDEADSETVILQLENPTGAVLGTDTTQEATITDDDNNHHITVVQSGPGPLNDPDRVVVTMVSEGGALYWLMGNQDAGASDQALRIELGSSGASLADIAYVERETSGGPRNPLQATDGGYGINVEAGRVTHVIFHTAIDSDASEGTETLELLVFHGNGGTPSTDIIQGSDRMAMITDVGAPSVTTSPMTQTVREGTPTLQVDVTLNPMYGGPVTLPYTLMGTGTNPATPGTDVIPASGTLNFPNGGGTVMFDLTINDDREAEPAEMFEVVFDRVRQVTPGAAADRDVTFTQVSERVTITDNDTLAWSLMLSPSTIAEDGSATLTISTGGATFGTNQTITLGFTGDAVPGTDFEVRDAADAVLSSPYELTLPANQTSVTATLRGIQDTIDEGTGETVQVSATLGGAAIGSAQPLTITDDDMRTVTIAPPAPAVTEGGDLEFTVRLSTPASEEITVHYRVGGGTATGAGNGQDYTDTTPTPSGGVDNTLEFAANDIEETITLRATDDGFDEADIETVDVTLGSPTPSTAAQLGTPSMATGRIADNDSINVAVSQRDSTRRVMEGGNIIWEFVNSDATARTFRLGFSGAATLTGAMADITSVGLDSNNDGTTEQQLTSGNSYEFTAPANQTVAIIVGLATDTDTAEGDETLILDVMHGRGGTSVPTGVFPEVERTATIEDVVPTLTVSIDTGHADSRLNLSEASSDHIQFVVRLSGTPSEQVTVPYSFTGTATHPPATAGADYMDTTTGAGTLTFAASTTALTQTITLDVVNDVFDEARDETVILTLGAGVTGAELATDPATPTTATARIRDDDDSYESTGALSVYRSGSSSVVNEGESVVWEFENASDDSQTFRLRIGDDVSPADIASVERVNLTDTLPPMPIPSTSQTLSSSNDYQFTMADGDFVLVTFNIALDTEMEGDENFVLGVVHGDGGTLSDNIIGSGDDEATIRNVVPPPSVSIAGPAGAVTEGGSLDFTVTLSRAAGSGNTITVNFSVGGRGSNPATSGDYDVPSPSQVEFTGSDTEETITIATRDDNIVEETEELFVRFQAPSDGSYTVATERASGFIDDNDTPSWTLSLAPSTIEEAAGGSPRESTVTISTGTGMDAVTYADPQTISLGFSSAAGDAVPGTDFEVLDAGGSNLSSPYNLTLTAGETMVTATLRATDDTEDEGTEETVDVSATHGSDPVGTAQTLTITDDDEQAVTPTVSIADPEFQVSESASSLAFTVSLDEAPSQTVTVDYTFGGTATTPGNPGADYSDTTTGAGTLTFNMDVQTQTITLNPVNDSFAEALVETVIVTLSNPTGATLGTATATGNIRDNDDKTSLAIEVTGKGSAPYQAREGGALVWEFADDSSSGEQTFRLVLDGDATAADIASVELDTDQNGTPDQTVTYSDGYQFTLPEDSYADVIFNLAIDSDTAEGDQALSFSIIHGDGGTAARSLFGSSSDRTSTIINVAAPTAVVTGPVTVDESAGMVEYTATLTPSYGGEVTLSYQMSGVPPNRATTPIVDATMQDLMPDFGTLTFAGTEDGSAVTAVIRIQIIDDTRPEPDETFDIAFARSLFQGSNPVAVSQELPSFTVTITDNDTPATLPMVSIDTDDARSDPAATEGASGDNIVFVVRLSETPPAQVTVPYSFTGTATRPGETGADYSVSSGASPLTFDMGATGAALAQTITLTVDDDTIDEPNETVTLTLGMPTGAELATDPATAMATITDDDDPPSVSIASPASRVEEDDGNLVFPVSLSNASSQTITVDYDFSGTATAPGNAGADYSDTTTGAGTLTFNAGDLTQNITLAVTDDSFVEAQDETVIVTISNPQGGSATLGTETTATGTIRDNDFGDMVNVFVSRPSGAPTSAREGGTLVWTFDNDSDTSHTFRLVLDGTATAADISSVGLDTNRDGTSEQTLTASDSYQFTLAADVTANVIFGLAIDGDAAEGNEALSLSIIHGDGGTASTRLFGSAISAASATITDVGRPTITFTEQATVAEDIGTVTYTVTMDPSYGGPVTANYFVQTAGSNGATVAPGPGESPVTGVDVGPASGTVTFAGTSDGTAVTGTITLTITDDMDIEADEGFSILFGAQLLQAGGGMARLTTFAQTNTIIIDNDAPATLPMVSIDTSDSRSDLAATEGASGDNIVFVVRLSAAPSSGTVSVPYSFGGTATAPDVTGADYSVLPGASPLTFTTAQTERTITLNVVNDSFDETNSETVILTLGMPTGAELATDPATPTTATATITDDDDYSLGTGSGTLIVSRSGSASAMEGGRLSWDFENTTGSTQLFRIRFGGDVSAADIASVTQDGTALSASNEYQFTVPSSFFGTSTIAVNIATDTETEGNETLIFGLVHGNGGTLSDNIIPSSIAEATITDVVPLPTVTVAGPDSAVTEGSPALFTLTRTVVTTGALTVPFTLTDPGGFVMAPAPTSAQFTGNNTEATVTINTIGDSVDEPNNTITLTLTPGQTTHNVGDPGSATADVNDDDDPPAVPPTVSIADPAAAVPEHSTLDLEFVVSLSNASSETITVDYAVGGGASTASANDYSDTTTGTGMLTFNAGVTEQTITLDVVDDVFDEAATETVIVTISNPQGGSATLGTETTATGTIQDNDRRDTVRASATRLGFAPYQAREGGTLTWEFNNDSGSAQTFRLVLDGAADADDISSVGLDTNTDGTPDQTLDASNDYQFDMAAALTGVRIIFGLAIDSDTAEGNEALSFSIIHGDGGTPSRDLFTLAADNSATIVNVGTPTLAVTGPATVGEGAGTADYTVTLTPSYGGPVTVDVVVSGDRAPTATAGPEPSAGDPPAAGVDVTPDFGLLTIPAGDGGQVSAIFTVNIVDDTISEADENLNVSLANAVRQGGRSVVGTGRPDAAVTTITDNDDPAWALSLSSASIAETGGSSTLTISTGGTISFATAQTISLGFSGDALPGTDFEVLDSDGSDLSDPYELTLAAGDTMVTATLLAFPDELDEIDESVMVSATLGGTAIGVAQTLTITDDDTPPSVSIIEGSSTLASTEGAASNDLEFLVRLSGASGKAITVPYTLGGGTSTATATTDYTDAGTSPLNFATGETEQTITLNVTNDSVVEQEETVVVTLLAPTAGDATLGMPVTATGTITDDDTLPSVTIVQGESNLTVAENSAGDISFVVRLSETPGQDVTVPYSFTGTATHPSDAGADYAGAASGTLTFATGATGSALTQTITRTVVNDAFVEADAETVILTLGTLVGATRGAMPTATAMITDTDRFDSQLVVDLLPKSVDEGGRLVWEFSNDSSDDYTFHVSFGGTATAADIASVSFDSDEESGDTFALLSSPPYEIPVPSGFYPRIAVDVAMDVLMDDNETIVLILRHGDGGTPIPASGTRSILSSSNSTATIRNVVPRALVTVAGPDSAVTEGSDAVFTLTRTVVTTGALAVPFTLTDPGGFVSGALTGNAMFGAGDGATTTVTINTIGDSVDEPNNTITLTLTPGQTTHDVGDPAQATATVNDDDDAPMVSIDTGASTLASTEGAANNDLRFVVRLSNPSSQTITVPYTVGGGASTAVAADYSDADGSPLNFMPSEVQKTITLAVTDDTIDEAAQAETVVVTLGTPTAGGATLGSPSTATGMITDNDAEPTLTFSFAPDTIAEDGGTATFTVSTGATTFADDQTIQVNFAGQAENELDYRAVDDSSSTTITTTPYALALAAGTSSATITITAVDDIEDERNENVILSATLGGVMVGSQQFLTITDDDPPSITVGAVTASVEEGAPVQFRLERTTGDITGPLTVAITVTDDSDVVTDTLPTEATFGMGMLETFVQLATDNDNVDEADATVTLALGTATADWIAGDPATADVTVTDNDSPPVLSLALSETSIAEATTGTATLTVSTGTTTFAAEQTIRVTFGGQATLGTDYTAMVTGGAAINTASYDLTLAAEATSASITIAGVHDTEDEPNESVTLSAVHVEGSNAAVGMEQTLTITDDDPPQVTVEAVDASVEEGDPVQFRLSRTTGDLSAALSVAITVTAPAGTLSAAAPTTAMFLANEATAMVSLATADDNIDEANATVTLALDTSSSPTTWTAGTDNEASVTVTDDDNPPTLSLALAPASIAEDGGAATLTVSTGTSTFAAQQTIQVAFAGEATFGTDYSAMVTGGAAINTASYDLTLAAGASSASITITGMDDSVDEPDESVTLNAMHGGSPVGTEETLSITDDDVATISISGTPSVAEGAGALEFTVTASTTSSREITVPYTLGSAGTAEAGSDYTAPTGSVTIMANQATATLAITTLEDELDEVDETVVVTLETPTVGGSADPSAAILSGTAAEITATGTITDNDLPLVTVADAAAVDEGQPVVFTLTRAAADISSATLDVEFTVSVPAGFADAGFTLPTSAQFRAGDATVEVSINTMDDLVDEADGTVTLTLTAVTGSYRAGDPASATVRDDDGAPTVSVAATTASVTEGGDLVFTVTASPASSSALTVSYTVAGGATNPAEAADYSDSASGSVTISAGENDAEITIATTSDTADEPNETVLITLTEVQPSAAAALVSGAGLTATGTIEDDDPPAISVAAVATPVTEGEAAEFTLTRTEGDISGSLTVAITVMDGSDVVTDTLPTEAVFNADSATATVTLMTDNDDVDEDDATVMLSLGTPTAEWTAGTPGAASITVRDNDDAPTLGLSFSPDSIAEAAGTATLTLNTGATTFAEDQNFVISFAGNAALTGANADYTLTGPGDTAITSSPYTLTLPSGETSASITITAVSDDVDEPDETIQVSATHTEDSNAALGAAQTLTITDDDVVSVSISIPGAASITEGGGFSFRIEMSTTSSRQIHIPYTVSGTSTSGADYPAGSASGIARISAGSTGTTLGFTPTDDELDEPNETFVVTLSAPTVNNVVVPEAAVLSANSAERSATGTILDNDVMVVSISGTPSVDEGGNLEFTITADHASSRAITVPFTLGGTAATDGTDYTVPSPLEVVIGANSQAETLSITTTGNTDDELDRTVTVTLAAPTLADGTEDATAAILSTASGATTDTGTITDDDLPLVTVAGPPAAVDEGEDVVFTLTREGLTTGTLDVTFALSETGDFAASGELAQSTVQFAGGSNTATVTVMTDNDMVNEANGAITLTLTAAPASYRHGAAATAMVNDNDTAPTVSVADATAAAEGDALTFTVSLGGGNTSAQDITVSYDTAGGGTSPAQSADYTEPSGSVTIDAGASSATITVNTRQDTTDEPDETVTITLTGVQPGGAATLATTQADRTAMGTITDDDVAEITISGTPSVAEGGSLTFTVSSSLVSTRSITVSYTLGGDATSGADYTAPSGSVTLTSGLMMAPLTITTTDDMDDESDETIEVTLGTPTVGGSADSDAAVLSGTASEITATGTIQDNDLPLVTVEGPNAPVVEGLPVAFTLTRATADNSDPLTVQFTVDVTARFAVSGTLPTSAPIPGGSDTVTVSIPTQGDNVNEPNGMVMLTLTPVVGSYRAGDPASATVQDDDGPPEVSLTATTATVTEGGDLVFTVTASPASSDALTVTYTVGGGQTNPAEAADYSDSASGTVTIAANAPSATITINTTGDEVDEPDETVLITLTDVSSAGAVTPTLSGVAADLVATGTITDDDVAVVSIAGTPSAAEGAGLTFTITADHASSRAITVPYTLGGEATPGDDYPADLASGELTLAAQATTVSLTITTTDDTADEPDETVVVTLSTPTVDGTADPSAAILSTTSGATTTTGTITDNDPPQVTVEAVDGTVVEGLPAVFRLTRTAGDLSAELTVAISVTGGSNVLDGAAPPTAVFEVDEATTLVSLGTEDDTVDEADATTVTLSLGTPTAEWTAGAADEARVMVTDNDDAPTLGLAFSQAAIAEAAGTARLTVNAGATAFAADQTINVTFGGAAEFGTDYTVVDAGGAAISASPYTLTLPAGDMSASITITAVSDDVDEADETITASATHVDAGGASLGAAQNLAITDDDVAEVSISGTPSVVEGESLAFTVRSSLESSRDITVPYTLSGEATSGDDYTAPSGTVTIAAGTTTISLDISTTDDEVDEPDESVEVTLSAPTVGGSADDAAAVLSTAAGADTATGTITDNDDPLVTVAATPASVGENESVVFTLTRAAADNSGTLDVEFALSQTGDFTVSGALAQTSARFTGGSNTVMVTVMLDDDLVNEASGAITLTLTAMAGSYRAGPAASATVTDNDGPPEVSVAATTATVTEGSGALEFTVTLSNPNSDDITVSYTVGGTATGGTDYTAPSGSVTIEASMTSATIAIDTSEDAVDEPDETVTITLAGVQPAGVATLATGTGLTATGTIEDDDLPTVTVAAERERVAGGSNVVFVLTREGVLSAALDVTISVSSEDSSVLDVSPLPTEAEFAAGADTATVSLATDQDAVAALAEAQPEAEGWVVTLTVQPSTTAYTVDTTGDPPNNQASVTVTPGKTDEELEMDRVTAQAHLNRQSVAVLSHVLESVKLRIEAPRVPGGSLNLGGYGVDSASGGGLGGGGLFGGGDAAPGYASGGAGAFGGGPAGFGGPGFGDDAAPGASGFGGAGSHLRGPGDVRQNRAGRLLPSGRNLLDTTSFSLTSGTPGGGLTSVWGRGAYSEFEARQDGVELEGDVTTGQLGLDWAFGSWLAGLSVAHSEGESDYLQKMESRDDTKGSIESSLTGVYPYLGYRFSERLSAWATLGYGGGDMTLSPEEDDAVETDLEMMMGALGVLGEVLQPEAAAGFTISLRGDAVFASVTADEVEDLLPEVESDMHRLRVGAEAQRDFSVGAGRLSPVFELGVLSEGGDIESGVGVDFGAGVIYARNGFSIDVRGRTLLTHEVSGTKEWGIAGELRYDTAPASRLGTAFSLRSGYGARATGGVDDMFNQGLSEGVNKLGDGGAAQGAVRLEAELGHGISMLGGRTTGTPWARFERDDTGGNWRFGWRFTPLGAWAPDLNTGIEFGPQGDAHEIRFKLDVRF